MDGDQAEVVFHTNRAEIRVNREVVKARMGGDILLTKCGIFPAELVVKKVDANSKAQKLGLKPGHILYSVNGKRLTHFLELPKVLMEDPGKAIRLGYLENGTVKEGLLSPEKITFKNKAAGGIEGESWTLGIETHLTMLPLKPENDPLGLHHPLQALGLGATKSIEVTVLTLIGFSKLLTGKASLRTLGGPVLIYKLAGTSYESGGWLQFIRMMAILSIALGVINLLPIPVLDGGHLFFFMIEFVKGSPVNVRAREIATQVGFSLLMLLMLFITYNDLLRLRD